MLTSNTDVRYVIEHGLSNPSEEQTDGQGPQCHVWWSGSRTARKQVPDGGGKWCPPYRLPRITPRTPDAALANEFADNNDDVDKVWGRFGYEHIIRIPELTPRIHKVPVKQSWPALTSDLARPLGQRPLKAGQHARYGNPSLHDPHLHRFGVRGIDEVHVYKSLRRQQTLDTEDLYGPIPTPVTRSASPAKSSHSVQWTLGSCSHPLFDLQGGSSKQGPFSRQFTVRCTAPPVWLRMKWGRAHTTLQ
ncbi:uncharacterized protein LOC112565184 [Pomacea canaliculata]|uniref:uncharacterized protein LOC112565184 n=1 Tax=Pomacea canaliculata TaxID=400727 RepID=UPI000D732DA2|nr:uncharacterized protein LOC112565184 [Pomacea canaliculata]